MSNLAEYSRARAARDPGFANGLEEGYERFKIVALLRQAREEAGSRQKPSAHRLATEK